MTTEHAATRRRNARLPTIEGDSCNSGMGAEESPVRAGQGPGSAMKSWAQRAGVAAGVLLALAVPLIYLAGVRTAAQTAAPSHGPIGEAAPARRGISGVVRIAPALVGRVEAGDTLFVFARAAGADQAPLAILRKPAHELPAPFFLDDSTAINIARRPSGQNELVIGARISRRGSASVATRGDLQGFSGPVRYGAAGVVVVIDSEVK